VEVVELCCHREPYVAEDQKKTGGKRGEEKKDDEERELNLLLSFSPFFLAVPPFPLANARQPSKARRKRATAAGRPRTVRRVALSSYASETTRALS
jgi:hypothetical protein